MDWASARPGNQFDLACAARRRATAGETASAPRVMRYSAQTSALPVVRVAAVGAALTSRTKSNAVLNTAASWAVSI